MRKLLYTLVALLLTMSMASCNIFAPVRGIRVYSDDYLAQYENVFDVMFENNWTLQSKEKKYEEHEPVCAHVDTRPERFIEWTIEYRDGNHTPRLFVFDNRTPLSEQIASYVVGLIKTYYRETFFDVYFKDVPLGTASYIFVFHLDHFATIMHPNGDSNKDEAQKMGDVAQGYLADLATQKGAVCLSKLTPANVFDVFPLYFSVRVSIGEPTGDKLAMEQLVMQQTEAMITAMYEFTNHRLTAHIDMGYHNLTILEDGSYGRYWTYIHGVQKYNTISMDFEKHVFEAYRGVFW